MHLVIRSVHSTLVLLSRRSKESRNQIYVAGRQCPTSSIASIRLWYGFSVRGASASDHAASARSDGASRSPNQVSNGHHKRMQPQVHCGPRLQMSVINREIEGLTRRANAIQVAWWLNACERIRTRSWTLDTPVRRTTRSEGSAAFEAGVRRSV
jgi:hypothetical protein